MKQPPGGRPRRRTRRAQRHEILVFTEGEKTEELYLLPWRRAFQSSVLVTIDGYHGPPAELVKRAVQRKKSDQRDERRGRGRAYDEIWCMFDVDVHANLAPALDQAHANSLGVAMSNPCIELWFILHFADQSAHVDRFIAQKACSELLHCGKVLDDTAQQLLFTRFEDARARARSLDEKHRGDGSPPGSNPSSSVWKLIDSIREPRDLEGS